MVRFGSSGNPGRLAFWESDDQDPLCLHTGNYKGNGISLELAKCLFNLQAVWILIGRFLRVRPIGIHSACQYVS